MLWFLKNGCMEPSWIQREQSSGVVLLPNPHTSEPTNGMPNICMLRTPPIDYFIKSQVDSLSPSQWAANFPDPVEVERESINGNLKPISFKEL